MRYLVTRSRRINRITVCWDKAPAVQSLFIMPGASLLEYTVRNQYSLNDVSFSPYFAISDTL